MKPKVSIVIPLYNRAHLIKYTLTSLHPELHQSVSLEVIVVDDASTDDGPDYVYKNFSWVKLIRNSENKGAPACRNQGLETAQGEFLFFLDSDDLVEPDFFELKIRNLHENKNVNGSYGPWVYFESDENFEEELIRPRKTIYPLYTTSQNEIILQNLLSGWNIPINATVWRTQSVRNVNGFDVSLKINQDVDFCFRMLLQGNMSGIASPRALIRIHAGERVGVIGSEKSLKQILQLRKYFVDLLKQNNRLDNAGKRAVSLFSFNMWRSYRSTHPCIAEEFLVFSKELEPRLKVGGSFLVKLLVVLFGNVRAVVVKQWIDEFRRKK